MDVSAEQITTKWRQSEKRLRDGHIQWLVEEQRALGNVDLMRSEVGSVEQTAAVKLRLDSSSALRTSLPLGLIPRQ